MRGRIATLAICLLGACAQPKFDPAATVVPVADMTSDGSQGTARLTVAVPCHTSDLLTPAALKFNSASVLLDGKPVADLGSCQYREITIPAGKHAIRVGGKGFDIGAMFGDGVPFSAPNNAHLYFLALRRAAGPSYTLVLEEVSPREAIPILVAISQQVGQPPPAIPAAEAPTASTRSLQTQTASLREPAEASGEARIRVVWPCLNSPLFGTGRGGHEWVILVGEMQVGRISMCSHTTVSVPSGQTTLRIADPSFDLRGLFGNTGPERDIPANTTLSFVVRSVGDTHFDLVEVEANRAEAEAKAVDATP